MKRGLVAILIIAWMLRLVYVLTLDPSAPYVTDGGDMRFYLIHGWALVSGQPVPGVNLALLAQPPVYFLVTGIPQLWLSPEGAVIAVRVLQALMGTLTAYFAYRMARRIGGEGAGVIAAAFVALNPIFILETGQILTETTYVFLVSAGLTVYLDALDSRRFTLALFVAVGVLLGAATLTRAVLLLFPLGLALHLLLVYRGRAWDKIAALVIAFALVVSTWTVYNLARWNRLVIAGEGLPAFLFISAAGWDDPQDVDQTLNETLGERASDDVGERQSDYLEAANTQISADVLGYVRRRAGELAGAVIQPHGTTLFAGESLRDMAAGWLRDDRTLAGLRRVVEGDQFVPKLLLYAFHAVTLIAGMIGAWRTRRRWRLTLPLLGLIAYTTLVHFFLLALPRYLFPTMLCWIVFGACAFSDNASMWHKTRREGV